MSNDALATFFANLEKNTGRSYASWLELARATGIAKPKALCDHLKAEHGLTHGYANMVALKALKTDAGSSDEATLMDAMFAGPKAELRPVYDRIVEVIRGFGDDVELSPKKGYVSIRRKKQFALAQPSTKDRFDLGINLKGREPAGRLEPSGSFNAMVSHRVRLAGPDDVDAEVTGWLREAYDAAG